MSPPPVRIFVSYARDDLRYLERLRTHVADLRRHNVEFFDDRDIGVGREWKRILLERLNVADIVILMVTANFVASDFCMQEEFPQAMQRQQAGKCVLMPLYVAPFDVGSSDQLRKIQWIPSDKPIDGRGRATTQAWVDVATELRKLVEDWRKTRLDQAPGVERTTGSNQGSSVVEPSVHVVLWRRFVDWILDGLAGGGRRRMRRVADRLEVLFAASPLTGKALDRAIRTYRNALRLALRLEPSRAIYLFRSYDSRIPNDRYALAFRPDDEGWLRALMSRDDNDVLAVVFDLAIRVRLQPLQYYMRDRMADALGDAGDANDLVNQLRRWRNLGLLDTVTTTRALQRHLTHLPLSQDAYLWSAFLNHLPESQLPELFEVHCFLGRGSHAVRLADTRAREREALICCAQSLELSDSLAGLRLTRRPEVVEEFRRLEEHIGNLYFEAGQYVEALPHYQQAGRMARLSECHERLGQFSEASASCPADQPERLARLVGHCQPDIDPLVERKEFVEAARRAKQLLTHLDRVVRETEAVSNRRDEVNNQWIAVLLAARRYFGEIIKQGGPSAQQPIYQAWSRFEEEVGELSRAAQLAEDGSDLYRAYLLYFRAELFGDADRVLKGDNTPKGLTARAEARETGGDLIGAAQLYEKIGQWESAVRLFMQAGEFAAAARALLEWRGEDAIEDPWLADCLRHTGDFLELARLCLQAVKRKGLDTRAVDELRRLRKDATVPVLLKSDVDDAIDALDGQARRAFEERAQSWVAQARGEIDRRFAGIWGFDLGTTSCAAAIYDTRAEQAVLCPWRGNVQFSSTLSLDQQGGELVGLAGEEVLANWVVGHIGATKRTIGTGKRYKVRDRFYRSEEVAARLIRHARGAVEGLLAAQVRERVGELANDELGEVRDEWLSWTEQHHDLRLDRSQVLVTIPAYFTYQAKNATRDACQIAGVENVRMIHEPTAACISAVWERQLTGDSSVVVIDLGGGTFDMSFLEVGQGVYDVWQVLGDNHYGGKDFDAVISQALVARLQRQGIQVPDAGKARRRVDVAAECLKVALSAQEHADYLLRGLVDRRDVRLELSRAELAEILAEPLRALRALCSKIKATLDGQPDHLVLVGGPMLSPLVRGTIEKVFNLRRTVVRDPRTAVACGAALQAAVLDGKLKDTLLLDVTPFALGIRTVDKDDRAEFSTLIEANTTIPTKRSEIYTTHKDDQTEVDIQIFTGQLDSQSKIGQFRLDDIPRAPRGKPQIAVTFGIDAYGVLGVTACNLETGKSQSIQITDTTLLSPQEVRNMAQRHQDIALRQRQQLEVDDLRHRLRELVTEAASNGSDASWREFCSRFSAYRPSQAPPEAETNRMLFEMFNGADQLELELQWVQEPLRDLVAQTHEYLKWVGQLDLAAHLMEGEHLAGQLRTHLDRVRPLMEKVTLWNAVLARLAMTEPDPLRRFRNQHDAGEFPRALEALEELSVPLDDAADLRRQLHCLAEVGDADRYRSVLLTNAERMGIGLLEPTSPEVFLDSALPALARVKVALVDSSLVCGSGFLIHDHFVLTNRYWLIDQATSQCVAASAVQVEFGMDNGTRSVAHIYLPDSRSDVALLRLAEPVGATPLRVGHSNLVRIGDRVWVAEPRPKSDGRHVLLSGLVDRFESFPEQGHYFFKVGIKVHPCCAGSPLFNDLGEVVGTLTKAKEHENTDSKEETLALTIESSQALLEKVGFNRYQ